MKIFVGSDHVGYKLKEELKGYLVGVGHEVIDCGNFSFDPEDDYVEYIIKTAQSTINNTDSFGVVIGKSGNGEQIAANKVKGVRAALCINSDMATLAREHNNANVLSLGADFVDLEGAIKIVKTFIETPFSNGERHVRRVNKISQYESSKTL